MLYHIQITCILYELTFTSTGGVVGGQQRVHFSAILIFIRTVLSLFEGANYEFSGKTSFTNLLPVCFCLLKPH